MRALSNLELIELIKELQLLEGFYIESIYELDENRFRFKLSKKGEKLNLQLIVPYTLNTTQYIEIKEQATSFAMAARKRIENAVIEAIEQYNDDRIIIIRLKKRDERASIIIEMFGKGNLIIAGSDMKVMLAYKQHKFKDREIKNGLQYIPPKKNVESTGAKQQAVAGKPRFIVYKQEGRPIDFSITEELTNKDLETQEFDTFQQLLDYFYQNIEKRGKTEEKREIKELKASIEKQKAILKNIDQEIDQNKQTGSFILNKMHQVNKLIDAAKSNKHITKEELQNISENLKILEVNLKDKKIKIEIKD